MPAQDIEPLLSGACGHLIFMRMIVICFANDVAVSRWFCSSSIADVVVSSVFVCRGLACASELARGFLTDTPGPAASGFAPSSGLFNQPVISIIQISVHF